MKPSRKSEIEKHFQDVLAARQTRWKKIGIAAMDTACLLISDPCYSLPYGRNSEEKDFEITDRKKVYNTMGEDGHFGQIKFIGGHDGAGIVIHSPFGDGVVDVWAKLDAKDRVRSVFFSFDNEKPPTT